MSPASSHAPAAFTRSLEYAKWMALAAAVLGWMFDGLEMGLFPLVGRPAMLEFTGSDAASGFWFSIIIAVFLVGAAFGGMLLGWLGDRIGRSRAMVWSVLAYSIFSDLCAFTTAPWQMAVLLFLAAIGMGGQWALGVSLVMEIFPSKSRPLMAGVIGASANVGFLLVALLSLGLSGFIVDVSGLLHSILPHTLANALVANRAWRLLMLLGALPALLAFFIRIFVPESEMWEKSSKQQAVKPRLGDLFKGKMLRLTLLGAGLGAVVLLGTWGSVQWIPAWADKISNRAPGAREWSQICSASGAILFSVLVALIAEKTNRRGTYFLLGLLSLGACQWLFRTHTSFGSGFLIWTFLVGGLTAGFYGWLPLYLPELFPTRLRASGAGITYNAGRVLAAGGTLGSGWLVKHFHGDFAKMCAVISMIYLAGMVLIWFAPETKGKPLPE